MKSLTRSPRTTAAGILGFVAVLATQLQHALDTDPATVADWNVVVGAAIFAFGFILSRDNAVNSRKAGAE